MYKNLWLSPGLLLAGVMETCYPLRVFCPCSRSPRPSSWCDGDWLPPSINPIPLSPFRPRRLQRLFDNLDAAFSYTIECFLECCCFLLSFPAWFALYIFGATIVLIIVQRRRQQPRMYALVADWRLLSFKCHFIGSLSLMFIASCLIHAFIQSSVFISHFFSHILLPYIIAYKLISV